jgi:hypothetical protein
MAEAEAALIEASLALGMVEGADPALPTDTTAVADATGDNDSFLVTLPRVTADMYPAQAAKACGERKTCKYSAWVDTTLTPTSLPLTAEQVASMTFSYLRDRDAGLERTLWNCAQVRRTDRRQCMKQQVLLTALPAPAATPTKAPEVLDGVRRKAEAVQAPPAKPTGR